MICFILIKKKGKFKLYIIYYIKRRFINMAFNIAI